MGLVLMVIVYIYARKRNYPKEKRATLMELLKSAWGASTAILTPVIIIGGMVSGIFTPTLLLEVDFECNNNYQVQHFFVNQDDLR